MEDFVDISAVLKLAIYVLKDRGSVVYIGKASLPLARLWSHRDLAKRGANPFIPIKGITYDQVLIKPAHPDRIDAELAALIAIYQPRHNATPAAFLPKPCTIERRI